VAGDETEEEIAVIAVIEEPKADRESRRMNADQKRKHRKALPLITLIGPIGTCIRESRAIAFVAVLAIDLAFAVIFDTP
jgi:hypothetical protein